jgi:hypothetical protein
MTVWTPEPEGTVLPPEEVVARALVAGRWVAKITGVIKPEAFEPHPDGTLSVTRHIAGDEASLWARCDGVAQRRGRELHGRADVAVGRVGTSYETMRVVAAARGHDPGHANVVGWPDEVSVRLSVQQSIAAAAIFAPAASRANTPSANGPRTTASPDG